MSPKLNVVPANADARLSRLTLRDGMNTFIDAYDRWLRAARYKPDTVSRAISIASRYLRFCGDRGFTPFTQDSAAEFLADAAVRIRPQTHLNYWKDLAWAFRFAMSQGLAVRNWVQEIPKPRPSLYERERDITYTEDEVRRLLAVCPAWSWVGLRDRAIILTLWTCGFRASEVCGLERADIHAETGEIRVRDGKGGVRYEGVLTEECALAIGQYLIQRPHDGPALFMDTRRGSLSRHGLEQMLRRVGRRARWEQSCFPHAFRHSFRVRMRSLGLDDTDTAALMGHRTVRSTWTYGRRQSAQQAKARLRERLNGG